ncbi:MAG: SIMPL domain-containing protein [Planctomycetes bacterium]|nr:SIMPL domain-containing protein [Planctomycetota bacterium]
MRVQLRLGRVGFVLALLAAPVQAQYPTQTVIERLDGITVYGTGEVRAKPNLIEIDLQNSGTGELSGDAIVKYRDNKRRMLQAFESLKLKGLTIEERGVSLTGGVSAAELEQSFQFGRANPAAAKAQLQVSRTLRLSLSGVQDMPEPELMETLGKIFDVAKDSGIGLAPSPEAQAIASRYGRTISGASPLYVLSDILELREQAYRKAIEDARARATRLATLTGVRLGPVEGLSEIEVSGDSGGAPSQPYYYYYGYQQPSSDAPGPRVTSATFADIPIRVKLQVRFRIAKSETETTEK